MVTITCTVVVALLVLTLGCVMGFIVGHSIGQIDGKYQERMENAKWADAHGFDGMAWHLTHKSIKDAVG